jgi:hypothetical protein
MEIYSGSMTLGLKNIFNILDEIETNMEMEI